MAIIPPGQKFQSENIPLDPWWSTDLGLPSVPQPVDSVSVQHKHLFSDSVTRVYPALPSRTFAGKVQGSIFDTIYNRIHVEPREIEVGNLVSTKLFEILIWNAYLVPRTLQSRTFVGDATGCSILGTVPPQVLTPNLEAKDTLTVTPEGPAQFDFRIFYAFDTAKDDQDVHVTGARIVSIDVPWIAPVTETLEWATNIIEAVDGTEQRITTRKAPRQFFEANYSVSKDNSRTFANRLYGWVHRQWGIPVWIEAQKIGNVTATQTEILVDTRYCDYRAGGTVYLWASPTSTVALSILTVLVDRLVLQREAGVTMKTPWCMPMRVGFMPGGTITRQPNGYDTVAHVSYKITDNISMSALAHVPAQFLGEDIYTDEFLMNESDRLEDTIKVEVVESDFETGLINVRSYQSKPKAVKPVRYLVQGLVDTRSFKLWLHRRKGRSKPFWIPTFESDIQLRDSNSAITTTIIIASDDYAKFTYKRNHIAILLTSGSWLFRTILTATDNGNGTTTLGLDSSLGAISYTTIQMISFLGLKRLDTDRVTLDWVSNRTFTCTVPLLEINP